MAWNDGVKFVDILKRKPVSLVEKTELEEQPMVEIPKVVLIETKPRAVEEAIQILPPLPVQNPIKVTRAPTEKKLIHRRKVNSVPKMRKVCYQTGIDKLFDTCWREEWVPAK